jgi:uncharacterized protein (DUF488 family)
MSSEEALEEGTSILTIGHSTRPIEEFLRLLRSYHVERVVDVRTLPRSRRNPQFDCDALPRTLQEAGIAYTHLAGLGGLRQARGDSPNRGWRNSSFRGFADYMQTPAFEEGLASLIEMAQGERIAIMCAEALPWRCHRSLISDALTARGVHVAHIFDEGPARPHRLTPWAHVEGTRVTYPPPAAD